MWSYFAAKVCPQPTVGVGSQVTFNSLVIGSEARQSCEKGYKYVSGDLTLTCQLNSLWLGEQIICQGNNLEVDVS